MRAADPRWQQLEQDIEALLEEEGYELVLMEVMGHPGRHVLRVRIDKPGGVTLEDCEKVSYRLSAFLDVVDPFPSSYRLEVSSPGVDRPLVKLHDFQRFAGQRAQVTYLTEGGRRRTVVGKLLGCEETLVRLEVGGEERRIPYASIQKAQVKYDWEASEERQRSKER